MPEHESPDDELRDAGRRQDDHGEEHAPLDDAPGWCGSLRADQVASATVTERLRRNRGTHHLLWRGYLRPARGDGPLGNSTDHDHGGWVLGRGIVSEPWRCR
jgi:hypothetical protein